MLKKYALPFFSIVGIILVIIIVIIGSYHPPVPPIAYPPPTPPFRHFVVGTGSVEANTENIQIGTAFNELVQQVFVQVGDRVEKGDPLFEVDTRELIATFEEAKRAREVAYANYLNEKEQLALYEKLSDKRAVSRDSYNQRIYLAEEAKAQLEEAEAQVERIETNIERSIIRAPVSGEILQINTRIGQSADKNPFDEKPLILFGNVDPMHVRIEIDEADAWRVVPSSPAIAYVRGNSQLSFPLQFVRIEPYIVPKESLTGDTQERVDTRVLQLIYSFERKNFPVYAGQLVDVYVEALPTDATKKQILDQH